MATALDSMSPEVSATYKCSHTYDMLEVAMSSWAGSFGGYKVSPDAEMCVLV